MSVFSASLCLAVALFCIGAVGALAKRNAISVFMCVELMLNAANLAIVTFAAYSGAVEKLGVVPDQALHGILIVLFVITVAAAEAAVGLAIFIRLHRDQGHIDTDRMEVLKG